MLPALTITGTRTTHVFIGPSLVTGYLLVCTEMMLVCTVCTKCSC